MSTTASARSFPRPIRWCGGWWARTSFEPPPGSTSPGICRAHAPWPFSAKRFPGFLAEFPPADSLPYLPDVARLERARLEALHAAEAATLAPAELRQLGSAVAGAGFSAHPAARIVESDFPIVDIWRANQPDAEPVPRTIASVAQGALITRPLMHVQVRTLTPAQAQFASHLLAGGAVPAALQAARLQDETFDLMDAFRELLVAGAFSRLRS